MQKVHSIPSISNDVVYENMDLYINAQALSNKKRATETFIEAARSKWRILKLSISKRCNI